MKGNFPENFIIEIEFIFVSEIEYNDDIFYNIINLNIEDILKIHISIVLF